MPIVGHNPAIIAYTGPGDVVSGAKFWWGLRAYSTAKIGTNAIRIRASGDNVESDIVTLSDGSLDVATVSSFLTTHGGNAFITTLYDQTGNGLDITQATAANQPQLTLSGLGSLPVMTFVRASTLYMIRNNFSDAQPYTFSTLAKRTATFTNYNAIGSVTDTQPQVYFANIADTVTTTEGTLFPASALDNAFHALQLVVNGASSAWGVDGVRTTGNPGTATFSGAASFEIGSDSVNHLDGNICEFGMWNVAFTAVQVNYMNRNQHSFWAF